MEYELFLRLTKVIDKYKKHFNEEPVIYRKIMAAYYDEISDYIGSGARGQCIEVSYEEMEYS